MPSTNLLESWNTITERKRETLTLTSNHMAVHACCMARCRIYCPPRFCAAFALLMRLAVRVLVLMLLENSLSFKHKSSAFVSAKKLNLSWRYPSSSLFLLTWSSPYTKLCDFHRTPPIVAIRRHRCAWRRDLFIMSPYLVTSQWTLSCFIIVLCIFVASRVMSFSTWGDRISREMKRLRGTFG